MGGDEMITPSIVWREKAQKYRLEAGKCKRCGKILFPPRLICPKCGGKEFDVINLPLEGKILSWTVIHTGHPSFSDLQPYGIVLIEVMEDVKILMPFADFKREDLKIGSKVKIEFRKIQEGGEDGVIAYGYKAVPCLE